MVRLGLDAVRPVPRAARERRSTSSERFPADFICEALDQTRGWFYSLLAISTLLFDQLAVPQRRLPGPDPRRAGAQDVQVARQRDRAVGRDRPLRRRRPALVLLHLQAAVGRLPLLAGDDRRGACASSCSSCGTRTASTCCTRTPTGRPRTLASLRPPPSRPTSTAGSCRACRRRSRSSAIASTTSTRPCAGRAIQAFVDELSNWYVRRTRRRVLGRRPGRVRDAAHVPARRPRSCSRRSARSSPTRSTTTSTAAEPSVHLCDFPTAGDARPRARATRWRSRARRSASGSRRAARPSSRCASRCAPRSSSRPAPSARRSSAWPRSSARSSTCDELRFVSEADELGEVELKPNYRTLGPRFGKQHADCRGRGRRAGRRPRRGDAARRRPVAIDASTATTTSSGRRPPGLDEAARGLPGRARGLARGRARARDRRRPARRGLGPRDRPRGPAARARMRASRSPTGSR